MEVVRGAKCRLCRRSSEKLYLKGYKCYTSKCPVDKRQPGVGMHGSKKRQTDYGVALAMKQKVRSLYGVLEGTFRRYYEEADRKKGPTGLLLLQMLESRVDVVVYRLHLAASLAEARQMVLHGHIQVNNKRVTIPSLRVKEGDTISPHQSAVDHFRLQSAQNVASERSESEWMTWDKQEMKGVFVRMPDREELSATVNEQLIVELYSKC